MRGPIVDLECLRPAAHVNAESRPRKRLLEYPLPKITGEEERVRAGRSDCGKQAKLGHAMILCLIHYNMGEWLPLMAGIVRCYLCEYLRPGMEAAIVDRLAGSREDRPEPRSLLRSNSILTSETRHV